MCAPSPARSTSFGRDIRCVFAPMAGPGHVDLASQRGRCAGLCALAIAITDDERAVRDHPDNRRSPDAAAWRYPRCSWTRKLFAGQGGRVVFFSMFGGFVRGLRRRGTGGQVDLAGCVERVADGPPQKHPQGVGDDARRSARRRKQAPSRFISPWAVIRSNLPAAARRMISGVVVGENGTGHLEVEYIYVVAFAQSTLGIARPGPSAWFHRMQGMHIAGSMSRGFWWNLSSRRVGNYLFVPA
jgi:hypothetical protein